MTDHRTACAPSSHADRGREGAIAAVAALGLVSTWAAESSYARGSSVTITLNGSGTVGLTDAVSFFSENSTITIDPPLSSVGASCGDLPKGQSGPITIDVPAGPSRFADYSFAGTIDNGDGTSDLVLGFAGDGSAALGVVWTSLFVDGLPDEERVFEPQVLAQLASDPVFDQDGFVERGSQLDRLDVYYRDLLTAGFGETLTLIAFNGTGNTGTFVGTVTVVPAPATVALVSAGVLPLARRRRRA